MEEKNKKLFSTILLSVGVLFIVVSGGIFVSQTWKYLTAGVKLLCLAVVTAGFFTGSCVAEKNSLQKAGTALYYLGICFTGFTTGMLAGLLEIDAELGRLLALIVMSAPTMIRFMRDRKWIDLLLQIFLCDGMILCTSSFGARGNFMLICMATFTLALAAMIYYCKTTSREEKTLTILTCFAFWVHAMITMPWTLICLIFDNSFFFGFFPVLMMVAAFSVIYLAFDKHVLFRILQSGSLVYGAMATSVTIYRNLCPEYGYSQFATSLFAGFVITLILTVALDRKELIIAGGLMTVFFSGIQVLEYAIAKASVREEMICHPYGICTAIALLAWTFLRDKDVSRKSIWKFTALFAAINGNVIISYLRNDYCQKYGILFGFALVGLLIAEIVELLKEEGFKPLFHTISLFFAEIALLANPILPTKLYAADEAKLIADFGMEYHVFFMGLGIVLLGIIWYDRFERIRFLQFVGACLLMTVLVFHNLAVPALPNVLFLGLSALAMLLVATFLKKKDYAILAATTLILVALYVTREVWMSIAWWVYLFVAGVGLVIFAIKKEKAE